MNRRLKKILNKVRNKQLREKVAALVENPQLEIAGKTFTGLPLNISPGGLTRHHSYPGGLVEHVVASAEIALTLCDVTERVYGGKVDRDLVIAGILLHDIFKPTTYQTDGEGYSSNALGERLEHLTLATAELLRRGFPLDLIHLVCAHHGGQAGPVWPRTTEALICHLADQTDSQLNGQVLRAARYLSRTATGSELPLMKSKEAFGIVQSKTVEGWDGVRETVRRIRRSREKRL